MRGFLDADFAAMSTLLLPCMLLWLGTHNKVTLPEFAWRVEKSVKMRFTTGWVEYGSAIAWTEERESVMITMEGDRGSGPERIVSRQWKMARSSAVKIEKEFRSLKPPETKYCAIDRVSYSYTVMDP